VWNYSGISCGDSIVLWARESLQRDDIPPMDGLVAALGT